MMVVDGTIPTGEPVAIERIAEVLGVDDTVTLLALMELGRDGFLERVGEDAVRVRDRVEAPGDGIIQVRRMLEPTTLRTAAEHARPVDLITLRHLADEVEAAVAARDYLAFRRADNAFLATLLSLHPNPELARVCTELGARTAYEGLRVPVEHGLLSDTLRPDARIVDLIAAGDFAGVESLAARLIDRLRLVGAPLMDSPHLVGAPIPVDVDADVEFLEVPVS